MHGFTAIPRGDDVEPKAFKIVPGDGEKRRLIIGDQNGGLVGGCRSRGFVDGGGLRCAGLLLLRLHLRRWQQAQWQMDGHADCLPGCFMQRKRTALQMH
ncbi:MAG: hypothetical protein B7Z47_04765 [Chthoniobacter sp. 12-60-6]|nr:MAG: hypothetical protein B7Z47_04765 [Chthoniobacter sp. 12-60-6]